MKIITLSVCCHKFTRYNSHRIISKVENMKQISKSNTELTNDIEKTAETVPTGIELNPTVNTITKFLLELAIGHFRSQVIIEQVILQSKYSN